MFVLLFLPCFHRLVLSLRSFSLYICLSCFLVRDFLFVTPRDFAGLTSQYIRTHKTSSLYARLYEYTRLTDSSWTPLFYWFILALGISVALSLPRSTDHDRSKRVAASPAENRGSANRSIHGWLAARRRVASRRHREGPVQPRSLRLSMTGKHDFRLANEYTSAIHRPIFFFFDSFPSYRWISVGKRNYCSIAWQISNRPGAKAERNFYIKLRSLGRETDVVRVHNIRLSNYSFLYNYGPLAISDNAFFFFFDIISRRY